MSAIQSKNINNRISQWQYESDSWKRVLEFIIQENIFRRNRLSEILKNSSGETEVLDEAEIFLERFLQQETLIKLLRNDILDFDKLLVREIFEDGAIAKRVANNHSRLLREVEKLKYAFRTEKNQFDHFLQANT